MSRNSTSSLICQTISPTPNAPTSSADGPGNTLRALTCMSSRRNRTPWPSVSVTPRLVSPPGSWKAAQLDRLRRQPRVSVHARRAPHLDHRLLGHRLDRHLVHALHRKRELV